MKILHSGDWHVGQTLDGYERSGEFRAFFARLKEVAQEEKPDVLVVAGDIYDNGMPSTAAQNLYTTALLDLHRACPGMEVVVIAGNHDSGARLEIARELWGAFGIHVVGGLRRGPDEKVDTDRHIIEIKDPEGRKKGYVVAVPYVHPLNFPDLTGDTPREERPQAFFQTLLDKVAERNADGLPVVLTAHLAVRGGDFSCHENAPNRIGGEECIPAEVLGQGFDYVALGHIHKPQPIPGTEGRMRYSGSVLPLNFDETHTHSLTFVEIERHDAPPQVRLIPLPATIPVRTVPAEPVEFEEALRELRLFPADEEAYIRVHVKAKDFLPSNSAERAVQALNGKKARYCSIKMVSEALSAPVDAPRFRVSEIRSTSPVEMAKIYYKNEYNSELEPELEAMLQEVWRETHQDTTSEA
ncbi:MAG: exonuclease subunit SbcD [Bacteroidales bacterium]|nr:exonuclease subunit SbcD [Bacteroidales bacterium]